MHVTERLLSVVAAILSLLAALPHAPAAPAWPSSAAPHVAAADTSEPLPRGCTRVTPPGEPEAACCLSGFVFVDGQAVAGAEVQVTGPRGDQLTLSTQVYSGTEARPFFQTSLTADPLRITAGETITVRARYGGRERTVTHQTLPGSQQIDIVLPRVSPDDQVYAGRIWGQAEPRTFSSLYSIATDSQGYVYAVDRNNARVQVFRGNGQFERQWGTLGSRPGEFSFPKGIAVDAQDNVYVADSNNDRIQKFSRTGSFITAWGSRGTGDGQFNSVERLAADRFGNIYELESTRVQRFSSTGQHIATWGVRGTGPGQFVGPPSDLAVDRDGNVYMIGNGGVPEDRRVQKYSADGRPLAQWSVDLFPDHFAAPNAVAVDGDGYVYVGDYSNRRIVKFTSGGQLVTSWDTGVSSDFSAFYIQTGLAVDPFGAVFAAFFSHDRISRYTSDGRLDTSWGARGRTDGKLTGAYGVAAAPDGSWYIADTGNNRVQRFSRDGVWLQSWGSLGTGAQQLSAPRAVAVGADGKVYVADTANSRIQRLDPATGFVESWGGAGQFLAPAGVAAGADGSVYVADTAYDRIQRRSPGGSWEIWSAGAAAFSAPDGVAVGGDGSVYVADTGSRRVQQRRPDGSWVIWAAPPTAAAPQYQPAGVAMLPDGRVLVADSADQTVHVFTQDGVWRTAWGGPGSAPGEFHSVTDVAAAPDGTVAVADQFDSKVNLYRTATYTRPVATIVAQGSATFAQADTIRIVGAGQDSDATNVIAAYEWSSDRDGVVGTGSVLQRGAAGLSVGTHRISLRVQDDEGEWSDPVATTIYVSPPSQATWTMLLYLAGDFHDGGAQLYDFTDELAALRATFRNPYVRIAVQVDGPGEGDTRRLLISPGTAAGPPSVTEIPIGERAMDSPDALADFLRWGQSSFPADHYELAIADHGQGVQGIAWDTTSDAHDDGVVNDSAYLTAREIGQALSADGVAPVDVLHLDACSMDLFELGYEVRQRVQYMVASQYLAWSYFAYDDYQSAIGPTSTPRDVALGVADRYAALARAGGRPYTIAVLDLRRAEPTAMALSGLASELRALAENSAPNEVLLDGIWQASRKLESNGDYQNNGADVYVDLLDWATRIRDGVDSPAVRARASDLIAELAGARPLIVSSAARSNPLPPKYGGGYVDLTGASGVSVFYPELQDSLAFRQYVGDELFSFTSQYSAAWKRFLLGVTAQPGPGQPVTPLPGPGAPLEVRGRYLASLPLIVR